MSDNPLENNDPVSTDHNQFRFTADSLKKKFRLSEFLSEKIISWVAYLCIAIIVLIFLFVFKEALPIFTGKHEKKAVKSEMQKPESYGTGTEGTAPAKPERYDGGEEASKPERYGSEPDSAQSAEQIASDYSADSVLSGSRGGALGKDEATLKSLTGREWLPVSDNPRYGLVPLVVGTLKITLIAILFAAPLAILAALFSAAFAPTWLRELIKPAIEL